MKSARREDKSPHAEADRRAFLASAGKFAIGVPPSLVVLLSTSMNSPAIAASGGGGGSGPTYGEHWGAPTNEGPKTPTSEGGGGRNGEDGNSEDRSGEGYKSENRSGSGSSRRGGG